MLPLRKLSKEELESIKEERRIRRQKFFKTLGTTFEKMLGDLISTARDILYPREFKITDKLTKAKQKEKVAIFWDYENFALPKSKVADDLFFSMIYPSKKQFEVISKKVFSKMQHIKKHLPILLDEGFEFHETTSSRKNATDRKLIEKCMEFCSPPEEKIVLILITGDRGYIKLIKDLVSQGHEVRLIHSSEEAISQEMKRLVPIVLDISILFHKRKSEIEKKMLREEDSEKWNNLWQEFTVLEENLEKQEEAINNIAIEAKTTTIRSRSQNQLIQLIEKIDESNKN